MGEATVGFDLRIFAPLIESPNGAIFGEWPLAMLRPGCGGAADAAAGGRRNWVRAWWVIASKLAPTSINRGVKPLLHFWRG